MEPDAFDKRPAYQSAERLADEIWTMVAAWPMFARDTLGKQLVRSADAVGSHLAAGANRAVAARSSLCETRHWLRQAFRRRLMNDHQVRQIKTRLDELVVRVNDYLRELDAPPGDSTFDASLGARNADGLERPSYSNGKSTSDASLGARNADGLERPSYLNGDSTSDASSTSAPT